MNGVVERDLSDFGHMRRLLAFLLTPEANCIDVGANHGAVLAVSAPRDVPSALLATSR
jgi:hypothetical protein